MPDGNGFGRRTNVGHVSNLKALAVAIRDEHSSILSVMSETAVKQLHPARHHFASMYSTRCSKNIEKIGLSVGVRGTKGHVLCGISLNLIDDVQQLLSDRLPTGKRQVAQVFLHSEIVAPLRGRIIPRCELGWHSFKVVCCTLGEIVRDLFDQTCPFVSSACFSNDREWVNGICLARCLGKIHPSVKTEAVRQVMM